MWPYEFCFLGSLPQIYGVDRADPEAIAASGAGIFDDCRRSQAVSDLREADCVHLAKLVACTAGNPLVRQTEAADSSNGVG